MNAEEVKASGLREKMCTVQKMWRSASVKILDDVLTEEARKNGKE